MYITYAELITRYSIIATWNGSQDNIENDLIYYAEREINSRLASHFTVPFSAGHPTVKDLVIDLAYYNTLKTKDPKKAGEIKGAIIDRIDDIKAGKEYIFTGSNTVIPPNNQLSGAEVWSNLKDYHPVNSMLDADDPLTAIDSDYLDELDNERS